MPEIRLGKRNGLFFDRKEYKIIEKEENLNRLLKYLQIKIIIESHFANKLMKQNDREANPRQP